jgi:hypothetical protein
VPIWIILHVIVFAQLRQDVPAGLRSSTN